jgi:hypothetical protein
MAIMDNGKPGRTDAKSKGVDIKPQRDDPMRFDQDLLTEEAKQALRAKAREVVRKEQQDKLSDALYAQFLDEERKVHDPKKQTIPIMLQLAGHANYIMLDGKQFHTDNVYHVTPDVAHVLIEQMNRGWAHEELTEVRDHRTRRRWRPPPGIGYGNFMGERTPRNMTMSVDQMDGAIGVMRSIVQGS